MMRLLFFTCAVVLCFASCSTEKKAAKAFRDGKYQTSIDLYGKVLKGSPNNSRANFFVGESYRLSNRLKEAESFYAKATNVKGEDKDTVQFYLAQALKANAKYSEAKQVLVAIAKDPENEAFRNRIEAEIKSIDYLEALNGKPSYYRVKNMEAINTNASEYSPVFLNNELYFTSSRSKDKLYEATGTPFTDIFKVSSRGANVDLATVAPLPAGINSAAINDGCISFSPDGKTMVFAKCNSGKKKGGSDCDLYLARYRNNVWTEPVMININQPEFWDSTPAFSADGRTLYFSSNRKGGYGGTDIYSAQMDTRGRFSRVKNLGPDINTTGNENFPYVADDGKLYFSSDEHPGFGGLDLFVVKRANGKTVVENLGQPMNSVGDDFGMFLFRPDRGFFTSNREGGKGDDDIYTFINEDPNLKVVNYYLEGITYTKDKEDKMQILANTKVSLLDESGELMQDFVTGNDGKFLFRVYENENYNMVGENDGYLVKRQLYTTRGRSVDPAGLKELVTNITFDTLMVLDKIDKDRRFALDNIYYEYNKDNINTGAAKELDKLVQLLIDNPEIRIELGSHTDSVDDNAYNLNLSQRRANSAVKYLVQHGIAPDRLEAKGYGEEFPIARNTNPDGTDNPVGRQKNRRTEFRILEVGVVPKKLETQDDDDDDKYFKNDN
jgi:peptidoglycan-associated lipoprotein